MNILYYFSPLLLLSLAACSSKPSTNSNIKTISIHLENKVEADVSSIIDSAYFIVPETNDSSIIGTIGTMVITDRIILTDRQTNKIIQFGLNGDHIATIDKVGNGPGEYIRIDGLCANPKNGNIIILDAMKNKFITYDNDFNFISEEETPVPYGATTFAVMDNNSFAFEQSINTIKTNMKYNIFIKTSNNTTHLLPFKKTANTIFSPRIPLYNINDTLIYVPTYNDTIYNIFAEKAEARIHFNFGDKWINEDIVYNPAIDKNPILFMEKLKEHNFVYFFNELENSTHIYADFSYKDDEYILTHNKNNNKQILLKNSNKEIFSEKPIYILKDFFIFPISYSEYINMLNSEKFTFSGKDNMLQIKNKIKEECNPILMFIKFK